MGAHPMGGTQEDCRVLTKLGSAPAHPAPRGHRHPRSWQVLMPITAPLAGPKEAGSHLAGDLIPSPPSRAGEGPGEKMRILCQVTPVCLSFPTLLALFLPGALWGEVLLGCPGKVSAQGCDHRKETLGGTGDWEERLN